MRIGIAGKGGSGKTSVSWMLLQALAQLGLCPIGMDADYNQHLAAMFGLENAQIRPLAPDREALASHVFGTRTDMHFAQFQKTTKPAAGSRLLAVADDVFLRAYQCDLQNGITLMRVGEYPAQHIGERCYHASTGAMDIMLNHLEKTERPLVVDYTAGVDPFASHIATMLDAVVLVIEPTRKGVEVARQWRELLGGQLPLYFIANKVNDISDCDWLAQALWPQTLSAVLYVEPLIRQMERNIMGAWQDMLSANQAALLDLWQVLQMQHHRMDSIV